jgi:EAL domain-containing protein (putative c-di-GMP-specific phosphodiesterase class I)
MSANSLSSEPSGAATRQTLVALRLAQAIDAGTLKVHYQPEIDLRSQEVLTLEALCRWQDTELQNVTPDEFIAVAETKDLIAPLGVEMLRQVLRDLPQILKQWPQTRVAINVSGLELGKEQFASQFIERVVRVNPSFLNHLELELTESIYLHDIPTVQLNLQRLKQAGIHLAIDDFGTGQSSLSRLHTLPFDKIKLDKSFVRGLSDPMVQAIVKAMVALTQEFNRSLVIEGLETPEQIARLTQLGCHQGQGYAISPPKSLSELAAATSSKLL